MWSGECLLKLYIQVGVVRGVSLKLYIPMDISLKFCCSGCGQGRVFKAVAVGVARDMLLKLHIQVGVVRGMSFKFCSSWHVFEAVPSSGCGQGSVFEVLYCNGCGHGHVFEAAHLKWVWSGACHLSFVPMVMSLKLLQWVW